MQRAHFLGSHRLPSKPAALADTMHSRGYIGQFTRDGELFVGEPPAVHAVHAVHGIVWETPRSPMP